MFSNFEFVLNEMLLVPEKKLLVGMEGLIFQSSRFGMLTIKDSSNPKAGEIKSHRIASSVIA